MLRVRPLHTVLPDVAQMGDEHYVTAIAPGIVGDVLHLFEEQLIAIHRETAGLLMPEIQVILAVRYSSDGELTARALGALCEQRDGGDQTCDGNSAGKRRLLQPFSLLKSFGIYGCCSISVFYVIPMSMGDATCIGRGQFSWIMR